MDDVMRDPMRGLDDYITGHYGEDQFKGQEGYESIADRACVNCFMTLLGQCPGVWDISEETCLVIQDMICKQDEERRATEDMEYKQWLADHPPRFQGNPDDMAEFCIAKCGCGYCPAMSGHDQTAEPCAEFLKYFPKVTP